MGKCKTSIGRLRARLDLLRHRRGSWKEAQNWQFEAELLEKRIAEISLKLEEYSRLESQNVVIPPLESLLQVPDYMIKRRIRSGISQIELAKRLGFSRNSILIYERTRYAGATLSRILQIDALMKELETNREFEISRFLESAPCCRHVSTGCGIAACVDGPCAPGSKMLPLGYEPTS